jgi:hypothetical protein
MPKKPNVREESEDSLLVKAAKAIGVAAGRVATIGRATPEARPAAKITKARKRAAERRAPQGKKKPVKRRAASPAPMGQDRPAPT